MTAVLSWSIGLLDGWSLNNNDAVLSTRVRMNDFHLPLWKSGLYFLASGFLLFLIEDLSGWIKLPSIRKHSASSTWLDEQSWMGYDGYDDLSHEVSWLRRTAVSTLQRLCPSLISHGFLIRVKWFQYWPCGRGFQSCAGLRAHSYCWPLFAILNWSGRIDQAVCRLHGQRLSVLMPAWVILWNYSHALLELTLFMTTEMPLEHISYCWDYSRGFGTTVQCTLPAAFCASSPESSPMSS